MMRDPDETVVVTGAFSYTGKYAARLLLNRGYRVRTLTFHPMPENELGQQVTVFPYNFERPEKLVQSLRGASTLINTYWVRFSRGNSTFEGAVRNTRVLIDAAVRAGLRRIVHVSIANPSLQSPLVLPRKGSTGTGRGDLRFGLRHPAAGGHLRIRPIYVEDMARLLADSVERRSNCVVNAVGPETFSFEELVRLVSVHLEMSPRLLHLPMPLAYASTRVSGWFVRDVILTWQEYQGLMADLLAPEGPSTGETCLSNWLKENRDRVGQAYASEVARHFANRAVDGRVS